MKLLTPGGRYRVRSQWSPHAEFCFPGSSVVLHCDVDSSPVSQALFAGLLFADLCFGLYCLGGCADLTVKGIRPM
jgi:hypothetical protein